jgi:glutathione S-transferase
MILIGQYDSPFVRRVAIAMQLYGFEYDHRPWSTFSDGERVAAYNPLRRVPTLVLDDGEALVDSAAILDWLDERAGPETALIASSGAPRREALRICALATGLADKAVSLFYERLLHREVSKTWVDRCEGQIGAALGLLEKDRNAHPTPYWFGERMGHGDIAVACALRFLREAHPALWTPDIFPALAAHAERCERLDVFKTIAQPFIPPS